MEETAVNKIENCCSSLSQVVWLSLQKQEYV